MKKCLVTFLLGISALAHSQGLNDPYNPTKAEWLEMYISANYKSDGPTPHIEKNILRLIFVDPTAKNDERFWVSSRNFGALIKNDINRTFPWTSDVTVFICLGSGADPLKCEEITNQTPFTIYKK